MTSLEQFEAMLDADERALFRSLDSPAHIQDFLDSIPYRSETAFLAPRSTLRDRRSNCFDGGLLAAAALWRLGHAPRILQLMTYRDDEHILALYERDGHLGCLSKSNFVGLRFREPIYRNLRELCLSYFESYYNLDGEKSLRGYTRPVDLRRFEAKHWLWNDSFGPELVDLLDNRPWIPLITPDMAAGLRPMDKRAFDAGMLGTNLDGVWVPPPRTPNP